MRVAFDSRPTGAREAEGYSQHLVQALCDTADADDEVHETYRPRRADDLFHTPSLQGALLHPPCPMVVTLHDLDALRHPGERLRSGGMHLRLRHLAVLRAAHVIVPSETVAGEVAAELGFERERTVVIPQTLTWEEAARATWGVYRLALAQPHRPCVTVPRRWRLSTPRAATARLGTMSGRGAGPPPEPPPGASIRAAS